LDERRLRKTLNKQDRQRDRQTNRHYDINGHLAVNQSLCKREDFGRLTKQLRKNVQTTAALKRDMKRETEAAAAYVMAMNNEVNIHGTVVNTIIPWTAASLHLHVIFTAVQNSLDSFKLNVLHTGPLLRFCRCWCKTLS